MTFKQFYAYLKVVLLHKRHVLTGCRRMRVPLWRGIIHDWDKFLPANFIAYADNFYNPDGTKRCVRDASGAYDSNSQPQEFRLAWLNHQRNKHHWQAWISIGDGGNLEPLPMPEIYVLEMIADWIGAGIAYSGLSNPFPWYAKNKDKMILHKDTENMLATKMVEFEIEVLE